MFFWERSVYSRSIGVKSDQTSSLEARFEELVILGGELLAPDFNQLASSS